MSSSTPTQKGGDMLISTTRLARAENEKMDAWLLGELSAATKALLGAKAAVPYKVTVSVLASIIVGYVISLVVLPRDVFWLAAAVWVIIALWFAYVGRRGERARRRAIFVASNPDVFRLDRDPIFRLLRPDLASAESRKRYKDCVDEFFRQNKVRNQALREDPDLVLIPDDLYDRAIARLRGDAELLAERMGYRQTREFSDAHELFVRSLSNRRRKRDETRDRLSRRVSVMAEPG